MGIRALLDKFKQSEIYKLVYNNEVLGLRVKLYNKDCDIFLYYDFDIDYVRSNEAVVNFLLTHQDKFSTIMLRANGADLTSDAELSGEVQVKEFTSEADIFNVLLPVIDIYRTFKGVC